MSLIKPFRGLRPAPGRAAEIAAPPYDVLSADEARVRAAGKPNSFLHISKAEIDLPPEIDHYAPQVYAKSRENFDRMLRETVLKQDEAPCYYVYRITMGEHVQTGIVAAASVADYDTNRIRKHEFTRPDKEDDRVRQIEAVNAHTGRCCWPTPRRPPSTPCSRARPRRRPTPTPRPTTASATRSGSSRRRRRAGAAHGRVRRDARALHRGRPSPLRRGLARRSRAARGRRPPDANSQRFLAVIVPASPDAHPSVQPRREAISARTRPELPRGAGGDFRLHQRRRAVEPAQARRVRPLPARTLVPPDHEPAPRPDRGSGRAARREPAREQPARTAARHRRSCGAIKRIDFVGGIRGVAELEKRVASGEMAAAFSMYPTQLVDLMSVADADQVMPPKSTWFEPKLADGLVSHVLD
jgi:hypothetical protein